MGWKYVLNILFFDEFYCYKCDFFMQPKRAYHDERSFVKSGAIFLQFWHIKFL